MTWCPRNDSQVKLPEPVITSDYRGETRTVRVWPAVWAMVPFVPGAMYIVAYIAGREVAIMGPFAGMVAVYGLYGLITRVGRWLGASEVWYRRHEHDHELMQ